MTWLLNIHRLANPRRVFCPLVTLEQNTSALDELVETREDVKISRVAPTRTPGVVLPNYFIKQSRCNGSHLLGFYIASSPGETVHGIVVIVPKVTCPVA